MADITDIVAILAATGLTVAEGRYEPDSLDRGPHIVVRHLGSPSLKADGKAYVRTDEWSASLYSERWEPALENAVSDALSAAGIPCDPSSGYDDEHDVHWAEWDFETLR